MNAELEQAKALREEAKELLQLVRDVNQESKERHASARDLLNETREMHCQMLLGQRRLSCTLSTLLPKDVAESIALEKGSFISVVDSGSAAEQLVDLNSKIEAAFKNRGIFDIVHAINVLAIANTDVLHIFTRFAGHVNSVEVYALSAETIYSDGYRQERLLSGEVRLDEDNSLESLLAIESQLTELIIEAREDAEAKAQEQAEVKA
ncbi:MAG: hypothetical protein ACRCRU_11770 [Vibrio sp.]|uniref:hypothetical protein n=1 Tax=Vibrio sp. TaxID=678 RepID=UPI003F390ECD